jgi:hypothetical protein
MADALRCISNQQPAKETRNLEQYGSSIDEV